MPADKPNNVEQFIIAQEKRHDDVLTEIVDTTGIKRSALYLIRKGEVCPSVEKALLLADYFNTSVEALFRTSYSKTELERLILASKTLKRGQQFKLQFEQQ